MIIAVNISSLLPGYTDDYISFVLAITGRMALQHPEHTFVFIVNPDFQVGITGSNVQLIRAGVRSPYPLRWKWWTGITLPALLKKCRADLVISTGYGCPRTNIPQYLVPAAAGEHAGLNKQQAAFFARQMPKYILKTKQVITFSATEKQDILNRYTGAAGKIIMVPPYADACFHPQDYSARQVIKERYTGGQEYLLYNGNLHPGQHLLQLLKAFSVFKKKQKTGMKLLLTGPEDAAPAFFLKDLQTYRYRDDISFSGALSTEERAGLTAGAYAIIHASPYEGLALFVLEALQSGVPVICAPGSAAEEIAGAAALYTDPDDFNSIAEKIILLYKDEDRRNALIREGLKVAAMYRPEEADLLWKDILAQ